MRWYENVIRPSIHALALGDPERAFAIGTKGLRMLARTPLLLKLIEREYRAPDIHLPKCYPGFCLKNPVGISAGLIKDPEVLPVFEAAGYGFAEIGGVTWNAQPGNPKPRMFLLKEDNALINRMGFNGTGARNVSERLEHVRICSRMTGAMKLMVNIGLSKAVAEKWDLGRVINDYSRSAFVFFPLVNVIVINIGTPNTFGVRSLQHPLVLGDFLDGIFEHIGKYYPISQKLFLLKFAPSPDFHPDDRAQAIEIALKRNIGGFVIANTRASRPRLRNIHRDQAGGLSGAPLLQETLRSVEDVRRQLVSMDRDDVLIMASGGLGFQRDSALLSLIAGADLASVNTAVRFRGLGVGREQLEAIQKAVPFTRSSRARPPRTGIVDVSP